jgi:hypothetical protein
MSIDTEAGSAKMLESPRYAMSEPVRPPYALPVALVEFRELRIEHKDAAGQHVVHQHRPVGQSADAWNVRQFLGRRCSDRPELSYRWTLCLLRTSKRGHRSKRHDRAASHSFIHRNSSGNVVFGNH